MNRCINTLFVKLFKGFYFIGNYIINLSNLTYIKYFNSDNSNKYVDIMLLSIFGAFSKPFYQFMTGLYT